MMAYAIQRRFPRIPFDQTAEIEYLDRRRGERVTTPVSVQSIACEGVGCLAGDNLRLANKSRVNLTFSIDGERLSLPGAVAWARGPGFGIHLLLELARPETRQRWAHWIVAKTSAHRRTRRKRTTSKKFR